MSVLGARRISIRPGFATGFDTETESEVRKRYNRTLRFAEDPDGEKSKTGDNGDNASDVAGSRIVGDGMKSVEDSYLMDGVHSDPLIRRRLEGERERRFGGIEGDECLERRRMVRKGETLRKNVLHVFGVDELDTREVMKYFEGFGPTWCEWLNDSSCNVAFEDVYTVRRVLADVGIRGGEMAECEVCNDGDGDGMSDGAGKCKGEEEFCDARWRRARRIVKRGAICDMWVRMATECDRRPEVPNPKSRWSRTINERDDEASRRYGAGREGRGSRRSIGLGVSNARDRAIGKARAKRVSRSDLDRALGA